MIPLWLAAVALAQAAPAEDSTLGAVLKHGIVLSVAGMEVVMTFKPNGVLQFGAEAAGQYSVDGKKLCINVPEYQVSSCSIYPDGKTSGDSFHLETVLGPVEVKIR